MKQTDHTCKSAAAPSPPGVGVSVERVDTETLRFVNAMFPRGYAFLVAFLALSRADQYILPTMRETSVAVLSGNNVRDVASHLGWSYEVTNQYFVLWTTLNLLLQERSGRQVTYLFPLTCYVPRLATLRALDALIAENDPHRGYRKAVKKLAVKVRERFLAYYGISPSILADLERLDSPVLVQALQGVGALLAPCGLDPVAASRLSLDIVLQVCAPLLSTARQDRVLLPAGCEDHATQSLAQGSPCGLPTGALGGGQCGDADSCFENPGRLALLLEGESVDSARVGSTFVTRNLVTAAAVSGDGQLIVDSGDEAFDPSRIESISNQNKKNITEKDTLELEGGDREQTESSGEGGKQSQRSEESLRAEAAAIGSRLDGPGCMDGRDGKWVGAPYIKRLKTNPQAVRIAMVSVLMQTYFPDKEYGVPKHPGKLFNALYKLYARESNPRQPSDEIASWVESPYSYQQIEELLSAERGRQDETWGVPMSRPSAYCAGTLGLFGESACHAPGRDRQVESTDRRLPEHRQAFLDCAVGLLEDCSVRTLVNELADEAIGACLALFDAMRGYALQGDDLRRAREAASTMVLGGVETNGQDYSLREIRLSATYLRDFAPRTWEGEKGIPEVWVVAGSIAEVWPKVHALLLGCELIEMEDDGALLSYDQYHALRLRLARELERDEALEREQDSVEYHLLQLRAEQEDQGCPRSPLPAESHRQEGGWVERPRPWVNPVEAALGGKGLRQALDGGLYGMELCMPAGGTGGMLAVWPRGQASAAIIGARVLIDNSLEAELFEAALELRAALDVGYYGVEFQQSAHGSARVKAWSRSAAVEDIVLFAEAAEVYDFIEALRAGDGPGGVERVGDGAVEEGLVPLGQQ